MLKARVPIIAASIVMATLLGTFATRAAEVTVRIDSVRGASGEILVAICDSSSFLTADCPHYGKIPIRTGATQMTFTDVYPGHYAVQVIHDENSNKEFDTNFLGMPTEGFGFSNNASGSLGPPSFEDAAIRVADGVVGVEISLQYLFDD